MELENKVIFLTGGATGIGYECAKAYVKEGANLAIIDNNIASLQSALHELGNHHLIINADVSKPEDVNKAICQTLDRYNRIDAIHNNAGIAHPSKALHDTDEMEWDTLININLKSIYLTTKFGWQALNKSRGCILNTSSLVGEIGQTLHAAYSATKGGINALTKSMALDYATSGIRVNAVAPAGVWTPMLRKWSAEQPNPAAIEAYLESIHPMGYCPNGDVVADACVFLLSDKARFITGCIMPVSGGAELGYRK
jgi:NAD(P)-dependent dehydrogenase (short-subunit alcohol dehydrogenase family)